MKKFIVNCDFGGQIAPFQIMIGQPEPDHHPLHFQAEWLSKEKGGTIPQEVMDSVAQLFELAKKHNVSLEELAVYALGAAQTNQDDSSDTEDSIDENNDDEDDDYSNNTESTEEKAIHHSDEEGSRELDNAAEEYNNDTNTYTEESEHHKSSKGRKRKKK